MIWSSRNHHWSACKRKRSLNKTCFTTCHPCWLSINARLLTTFICLFLCGEPERNETNTNGSSNALTLGKEFLAVVLDISVRKKLKKISLRVLIMHNMRSHTWNNSRLYQLRFLCLHGWLSWYTRMIWLHTRS